MTRNHTARTGFRGLIPFFLITMILLLSACNSDETYIVTSSSTNAQHVHQTLIQLPDNHLSANLTGGPSTHYEMDVRT